jgi:hypothetical protein
MMKMKTGLFFLSALLLSGTGCKTTEQEKPEPISWKQQSAYMAKVKDPRRFGYSIYQTPGGIEYRGGSRLHPNQAKILKMEAKEPLRPVVMLRGKFGMESPILLDFTAATSWMEFDLAESLGAVPLSEGKAQLVKMPNEEFLGCLSVVPTISLGQLFIENPLVYVRLANGPLGSLARGIDEPEIKGVLGWELLKKFEQIYFDYTEKRLAISTAKSAYMPDPSQLIARIPLVKYTGACAVRGAVDGKQGLILIDPAGDFEVATDSGETISSVQLDANFVLPAPAVVKSTGGTRIGARLLEKFKITICPQEGMIYFEKPETGEKE